MGVCECLGGQSECREAVNPINALLDKAECQRSRP